MENAEKTLQDIVELLNGPEGVTTSQIAYPDTAYYVVEEILEKYHELDAILEDIGNRVAR
jgi:hypothetical protein